MLVIKDMVLSTDTKTDNIPAIFYKHDPSFSAGNMNVSELARVCDLSCPTVYKDLKLTA